MKITINQNSTKATETIQGLLPLEVVLLETGIADKGVILASRPLSLIESAFLLQMTYTGFRSHRQKYWVNPINPYGKYYFTYSDIMYLLDVKLCSEVCQFLRRNNAGSLSAYHRKRLYSIKLNQVKKQYKYVDPTLLEYFVYGSIDQYYDDGSQELTTVKRMKTDG